jgi:hypothetical protein
VLGFYGEELFASQPTPKLEVHILLAARDCLFNILKTILHIQKRLLHPHPEDAPCHGDRDALKTIVTNIECSVLSGWSGSITFK